MMSCAPVSLRNSFLKVFMFSGFFLFEIVVYTCIYIYIYFSPILFPIYLPDRSLSSQTDTYTWNCLDRKESVYIYILVYVSHSTVLGHTDFITHVSCVHLLLYCVDNLSPQSLHPHKCGNKSEGTHVLYICRSQWAHIWEKFHNTCI